MFLIVIIISAFWPDEINTLSVLQYQSIIYVSNGYKWNYLPSLHQSKWIHDGFLSKLWRRKATFAIEFSQPIDNMVFLGLCHLRFDNRGAVIVDYAANCMKCEIIGLAGSTVPNPIQLTRFCNVSDMSDRIPVWNRSTTHKGWWLSQSISNWVTWHHFTSPSRNEKSMSSSLYAVISLCQQIGQKASSTTNFCSYVMSFILYRPLHITQMFSTIYLSTVWFLFSLDSFIKSKLICWPIWVHISAVEPSNVLPAFIK